MENYVNMERALRADLWKTNRCTSWLFSFVALVMEALKAPITSYWHVRQDISLYSQSHYIVFCLTLSFPLHAVHQSSLTKPSALYSLEPTSKWLKICPCPFYSGSQKHVGNFLYIWPAFLCFDAARNTSCTKLVQGGSLGPLLTVQWKCKCFILCKYKGSLWMIPTSDTVEGMLTKSWHCGHFLLIINAELGPLLLWNFLHIQL